MSDVTTAEIHGALGAMRTHVTACGMWHDNTKADAALAVHEALVHGPITWDAACPYCGVTLLQMLAAERRGVYICGYSRRNVVLP